MATPGPSTNLPINNIEETLEYFGTIFDARIDISQNVVDALYAFFIEPITTSYGWAELGVKATPLILIGVALSIGFRAGVWNIGAEGQLTLGAICGGGIALWLYDVDSIFVLPSFSLSEIQKKS